MYRNMSEMSCDVLQNISISSICPNIYVCSLNVDSSLTMVIIYFGVFEMILYNLFQSSSLILSFCSLDAFIIVMFFHFCCAHILLIILFDTTKSFMQSSYKFILLKI